MLLLINYITNSVSRASCLQAFLCINLVCCSIFIGGIMTRRRKEITYKMNGDCMECTSHFCSIKCYPQINRDGKKWGMSRYVYTQEHGNIPEGLCIRHTCDNKMCINIQHLLIGTIANNMQDKVDRNRQQKGEDIPYSKLTTEQVLEIRNLKGVLTQVVIAKKFNITPSNVGVILSEKSWKHLLPHNSKVVKL